MISKGKLKKHFHEKHSDHNASPPSKSPDLNGENHDGSLKEELRALKNNFQRLETLFRETVDQAEKDKIEYGQKLAEANEANASMKKEQVIGVDICIPHLLQCVIVGHHVRGTSVCFNT